MKNVVKAMDKNVAAFQRLSVLFLTPSFAKLKDNIFVRPHIQEVLKDKDLEELPTLQELGAWKSLKT